MRSFTFWMREKSAMVLVLLFVLSFALLVQGRSDDHIRAAVGIWNVSLQTCCHASVQDASHFFFPPLQQIKNEEPQSKPPGFFSFGRRLFLKNRVDCTLALFPNGTFFLSPTASLPVDEDGHHTSSGNQDQSILYMRGKWKLEKNPYCATDRYYDTLKLTSYSQSAHQQELHKPFNFYNKRAPSSDQLLERRSFLWQTELHGLYSRSPRLVRGTCLLRSETRIHAEDDEHVGEIPTTTHKSKGFHLPAPLVRFFWNRARMPVIASFSAKKIPLV